MQLEIDADSGSNGGDDPLSEALAQMALASWPGAAVLVDAGAPREGADAEPARADSFADNLERLHGPSAVLPAQQAAPGLGAQQVAVPVLEAEPTPTTPVATAAQLSRGSPGSGPPPALARPVASTVFVFGCCCGWWWWWWW